ncbi:MAG TPA: M43 family zinc metalloprotease, partial [Agriterribacter sp.]|nr:M43 family zinc metalloprotease [Agriterribacter sp.]
MVMQAAIPLWMLLVCTGGVTIHVEAQPAPSWGCGDERFTTLQKESVLDFERLQQRNALRFRSYIHTVLKQRSGVTANRVQGSGEDSTYTIPVVVHVVHAAGEPYGTGGNISYAQIRAQLEALNAAFGKYYPDYNGQTHPSYAQDTRIRFCFARTPSPQHAYWATGPGGTEYGVRRYPDNTGAYDHFMTVASASRLKSVTHPDQAYFPFDQYLNIWLVKTIDGGNNVIGYAPKPLTGEYPIDGVVMRSDIFGDNTTGGSYLLGFNLTEGKVLAHEMGHYLNLYHIFQGGCAGANPAGSVTDACDLYGDYICDTKPSATQNVLCNSGTYNTCTVNYDPGTTREDMINNYMSYADDDCMNTFTMNQRERMWATLELLRKNLWQTSNLAATGVLGNDGCVPPYLNASITTVSQVFCAGKPVLFSNITAGNTAVDRKWQFPGALPSSAVSDTITVVYNTPGVYQAVLTVTDG